MPATYEPIATQNGTGSSGTVTFSGISSAYTDLYVVVTYSGAKGYNPRLNSDSGTNYSITRLYGNGSTASSDRLSNQTALDAWGGNTSAPTTHLMQIQNYSNTTTFKTVLIRTADEGTSGFVKTSVSLWRNTAAVNTLTFTSSGANYATTDTFTLYGIKAA